MQYYNIAGLGLRVDGTDYDGFIQKLAEYRVENLEKPDVSVRFDYNNSISEQLPQHFAEGNGRFYFETENHYGFYDIIGDFDRPLTLMKASKDWKDITYTFSDLNPILGIENDVYIKNVFGHLFEESFLHFDGIVVHASTIVYNGKAVTFTAPSGTGKSTHTALWQKYYPETVNINDDTPALRLCNGEFYAYGTPWCGKTDINKNISAPLCGMVFIERSEECSITELSPMEAFIRMMREVPMSPFKEQSDLRVSALNQLFSKVPAYLLKCNISKDAVETVKNKLF